MKARVLLVILLTFGLVPIAASSAAADGIYRWTDAQGVIHFTDSPENIPPEFRPEVPSPEVPSPEVPSGARADSEEARAGSEKARADANNASPAEAPGSSPAATVPDKARAAKTESEAAKAGEEPAGTGTSPYEEAVGTQGPMLDNFGRDETYWRDRKNFWEQRLADAQQQHDDAFRQFNRLISRTDNRHYREMKELRGRMEMLEKEIAKAQGMLDGGLAREARKAGAPPGWVR